MKLRKCKNGEMHNIIDVANQSFATVRKEGYTFKHSQPQIYDNQNYDYSNIHFVIEDDNNQFISVAGNLIDDISVDAKTYKFSRVGTVGTIPAYREKGYMKQIMKAIEKENLDKKVVFSILHGKRNRYKNYGYDKAGLTCYYIFDKNQTKYLKNDSNINVRQFKKDDLDSIYEIYKKNQRFILRKKDNFEICLSNYKNKLYTFIRNDEIVGYVAIEGSKINEINLVDNKYLEGSICCLLKSGVVKFEVNKDYETIQVCVNILDRNQCVEFDRIAESKCLYVEYSFKVYNLEKFIEMLFLINKHSKELKNAKEIYQIENECYEFVVKNNQIKISQTNDQNPLKSFQSKEDFIRFVLGTGLHYDSKIFPLYFDLNPVDNF